jgi:hypothetical protein
MSEFEKVMEQLDEILAQIAAINETLKEERPALVDLMDTPRNREKARL